MEDILTWLQSDEKDYQTGLSLYGKYGKNKTLLNTLSKKENSFNREKLDYELRKTVEFIMRTDGTFYPEEVFQSLHKPQSSEPERVDHSVVSTIESITLRQSELYHQKARLSNQLADFGDENDEQTIARRKEVVEQITAIEETYNSLAEKKKILEAGGNLSSDPGAKPKRESSVYVRAAQPEQQADKPSEPRLPDGQGSGDKAELVQLRNNLRSNLSKAKAVSAKSPADVRKAEKVARLEAELAAVETQLKLSNG